MRKLRNMKSRWFGAKWMLLVCSVFFIYTGAMAQSKEEAAVLKQLDRLNDAIVEKKEAVLKEVLHDALWYGHSGGRLDDKKAAIEDIMNGPIDFLTLKMEDVKVQVADNNATVRFIFDSNATNKGESINIRIGVMTVWKKDRSGWKLFARQAYKL